MKGRGQGTCYAPLLLKQDWEQGVKSLEKNWVGSQKSLFLQGIARVILLEMFLSCEGYYDMGMKNGTSMNVKFKKQLQLAN